MDSVVNSLSTGLLEDKGQNVFLREISEEEIRLTEKLQEIEQIFLNGIDTDKLLGAISASQKSPDVTLVSYSMQSSDKKGFYNAEVILNVDGRTVKGVASEVEGVVNASVKAAQNASGQERFRLNSTHPIEIRMVAHRIEGLVEVTIQVDDTETNKTFIGSFVDYDIMGAAINAYIDAVNQALNPEVGSKGLEHSFISLINDPDNSFAIELKNNLVFLKEPPGKETIRAVFYILSALHQSSSAPLYEIVIETIFQAVIKKTHRDPASIIAHTLETYSYVRAEAWDILKSLIHREDTENAIIFNFREITKLLDLFDRLGSESTRRILTVLGLYFLDQIVEKAGENIAHRLSDLVFVFDNLTPTLIDKVYDVYKEIRVGSTRIILDGFRNSFSIKPAIDLLKTLSGIKRDSLVTALELIESRSGLLEREALQNGLLRDFHWTLSFILEINEEKLEKWKYLISGRLYYLQEDFERIFKENPVQAIKDFRKIVSMDVVEIRKTLEGGNLFVPLHNLEDFIKNKSLSFGQDSMCNYCESGAFNIVINEDRAIASRMMRELKLYPPVSGIPEQLGGNIVFDGWENGDLSYLCNETEYSPIMEIHNSGLADTFHKLGQKEEHKGPYPEKPALHRNKRGILIERDAVRQQWGDKYIITTGYGININMWLPYRIEDEDIVQVRGYWIKPVGIGIKVHDIYREDESYLGSRLTIFEYNPYKRVLKNIRTLGRREADILAFILDYENLFSIVLRTAHYIKENILKNPEDWKKRLPLFFKDIPVESEEAYKALSAQERRYLLLPFVVEEFSRGGFFIDYIRKTFPFLRSPKADKSVAPIKDKKLGQTLLLFFQKRKKRVKAFMSKDGFVIALPRFKRVAFGLYGRRGIDPRGEMLNSLPEFFSGDIFWGVPTRGGFYLNFRRCKDAKVTENFFLTTDGLLNKLIHLNYATDELARMAEGMKVQLAFRVEKRNIFYGTRTIYGLKTRFFIEVNKLLKQRRGAYYVGKEIFKGTVVTRGPLTTGWIHVIEDDNDLSVVKENDIVVVHELKPGVEVDLNKINALVVEAGGPGSHSAIITKGKGITLLLNKNAVNLLAPYQGEEVQIDPVHGLIKLIQKTDKVYTGKKIKGMGALPGEITGKIRYIERIEPNQLDEDYILLTNNLSKNIGRYFSDPHLKGIVSERGGTLSRVIEMAKEYLTIPIVTGFDVNNEKTVHEMIDDGVIVTIDGTTGIISPPKETFETTEYFYSKGDKATCMIVNSDGTERWADYEELEGHSRSYMDELEKVLNKKTRPQTLRKLAQSIHTEIRVGVARHSNTPYEILYELVTDPDPSVRRTVVERAKESKKLTSEEKVDLMERYQEFINQGARK